MTDKMNNVMRIAANLMLWATLFYLAWLQAHQRHELYKCAEAYNVFRCTYIAQPLRDILPPPVNQ